MQMADIESFLFTSESVNEGHPDKLADQVRVCLWPAPIQMKNVASNVTQLLATKGLIMTFCPCRFQMLFWMLALHRTPMPRYVSSSRLLIIPRG